MSSWIMGLALAAMACALALIYLWLVRRSDVENTAGLHALAGLRWREFSTLVAQAMQKRGLRDVGRGLEDEQRGDGGTQMLMTDGSRRWLLSCKHGMAYRISAANIDELAAEMDLAGAGAGILLTEGRAERDAMAAAERRGIEIIDNRRLWPLLKPFLPSATTRKISDDATAQARRHSVIAVLGSLALGMLVGVLAPRLGAPDGDDANVSSMPGDIAPPAPAPAPEVAAPSAPAPTVSGGDPAIEADPDDATLARYQGDIARALSDRAGIDRAYWLTRATLVIDREAEDEVVWPVICAELDRYPPLRNVRVQLNPRPGSSEAVRWRQCRTM